jgi:hypothetical protein
MPIGRNCKKQNGYIFMQVIALVFAAAVGSQALLEVVHLENLRAREELAIRIGKAYAQAIARY